MATPLPELKAFGEHMYFADDPQSFLKAIREAIEADSPEKRRARADFMAGQDWDTRVEEIYKAIEEIGGLSNDA